MTAYADIATGIGRVLLSAIFILAGFAKLMGAAGTIAFIESKGLPLPQIVYALTVALELGGGLLLLVGFQARWVALAFAGFCVVSALIFHLDFSDQTQQTMFLKNLAIAGGMLFVFANGAGGYSIDRRRGA
ncbi:DoxX family protein [Parvibaculum sp.]|uniref:DoxX family protein n=1 Tax=Parvibaculum sp. TaxID=2024848 RepID=UPI00271F9A93|nr:DoxX family protein [Parvibaculum sp.]MDO9126861.1 DoxX family protein [Parvibaculum sp.]MDP1627784.1 DoxX family protein [Parvibaculum sp.]MDP2150782.1 DoxX family protein [Parvibaculum sp.]MDP3327673.1 DoxX family protein [Parvibaculum sp.]